ncbi:Caleosin-domain-containing protein [Coprinopsis marcescibilis]|uniref:Caleosin-domain-containing protein n=1 Tax=Coprinopsis marcescibilis TaxID=230819 RepID=A0A5C3KG58_COPMA|nr:Caleosin-domain-containing protein [Coprinopsis marcescibilis]
MVAPKNAVLPAPGKGFDPEKTNTPLQGHVAFFDRDGDGIIWPSDTYSGFRDLNFGIVLSFVAMVLIHTGFSYITMGSWVPDPFFRMNIKYMHRGKHGSDSGVYTQIGEFDDNRFTYLFDMYTEAPHSHMTLPEAMTMVHGNMNPWDFFGWFAGILEWAATYVMLWPEDGKMAREDIKGIYNGSIFYMIAGRKPMGKVD